MSSSPESRPSTTPPEPTSDSSPSMRLPGDDILKVLPLPTIAIDLHDGTVMSINERFAQLLESTPSELMGQRIDLGQMIFQFEVDWLAIRKQLVRPSTVVQRQVFLRPPAGTPFWASASLCRLDDAGLHNVLLVVLNDITELVEARTELAREREDAEKAAQELIAENALRSRLVSNIGRRLRTAVSDMLNVNKSSASGAQAATRGLHQHLKHLQEYADRMLGLLEQIEALCTTHEHDEPVQRNCDIWELFEQCHAMINPSAMRQGVETGLLIDEDTPRIIITDPERLRGALVQMVPPLVECYRGGQLTLQIDPSRARGQDERLRIRVHLRGPRAPKADLDGIRQVLSGDGTPSGEEQASAYATMSIGRRQLLTMGATMHINVNFGTDTELVISLPYQPVPNATHADSTRPSTRRVFHLSRPGIAWKALVETAIRGRYEPESASSLDSIADILNHESVSDLRPQLSILIPYNRLLVKQLESFRQRCDGLRRHKNNIRCIVLRNCTDPEIEFPSDEHTQVWTLPLGLTALQQAIDGRFND